ncbi:MAG: type II secretion system protein GspN [Deltaproteobacteria bacterium]
MRISGFARDRRFLAAVGILLFFFVFLSVFLYSLPKETVLSPVASALRRQGIDFSCEDAGISFPLGVVCRKCVLTPRGGGSLSLDSAAASWEWTGLIRWLPVHLLAKRGAASLDIRTSPMVSSPSKVRLRLASIGSEDMAAFLSAAPGTGFLIDAVELQWKKGTAGGVTGAGEGALSWLRFPIPDPNSPVREALLRNVKIKFAVREGTLHISSLTATYEGSAVDGTGEVARFLTPSQSAVTFHLRIQNPLEGRIATLFDMVAKNAKNATLRVKGALLSPTGEFQFF